MVVLEGKKDPSQINIRSGLKNWRYKLKNIGETEILDIAIIGDSISEGYQVGADTATLKANGFKFILDDYFSSIFEDCGEGYMPYYYPTNSQQAVFGGTWINHTYSFVRISKRTVVDGSTVSFPFTGPSLQIWTGIGTGAIIDVSIDEGEATRYTLSGTLALPALATIATGLSNTTHTCTITNQSRANNFHFAGWMETKGTRGIRTHMCAKSGSSAASFINATKVLPYYTLLAPDLAIIHIGTNDYMSNVDPDTYESNLRILINHLISIGTDVLLLTQTNDRTGYTYNMKDYNDKLRLVARDLGVGLLDLDRKVIRSPRDFYFPPLPSDDIHPTIAGHSFISSEILKVIGN